jgi:N-acylneuraminate cytidylyltransferase
MKFLYVITARAGSKGVPGKNIKPLKGKALIHYTIDAARIVADDEDICVSTDGDQIIQVVEDYGLKVPFKRPEELAGDTTGSYEVLLHAIEHYAAHGKEYDAVVLLQPTSPFRNGAHVKAAIEQYTGEEEMLVSAYKTKSNPYFVLYESDDDGWISKSKTMEGITRRQDMPDVYQLNGAIYVINIEALKKAPMNKFTKVKPFEISEIESADIDTMLDWDYCEFLIEKGYIKLN